MSTPNHIFDIARENAIAHQFTEAWLRGNIEWEVMLFELANAMEKECNRLVDENNLREAMTEKRISSLPNYVLEKSLIPDLHDIKEPIKRQEKLIESIVLINEFHKNIFALVLRIVHLNAPVMVINTPAILPLASIAEASINYYFDAIGSDGGDRPA